MPIYKVLILIPHSVEMNGFWSLKNKMGIRKLKMLGSQPRKLLMKLNIQYVTKN